MRVSDSQQTRVRIVFGERDLWHHAPLASALLERLRKEGFAGATVFHGVAGFGAQSVMHTANILRLSEDLPVLVEIVEAPERVPALLAILDEMVGHGLATLETVRAIKFAPGESR